MYRDGIQTSFISKPRNGFERVASRIFGGRTVPAPSSLLFSFLGKLFAALFVTILFHTPAESLERVIVLEISGPINPVVSSFVVEGVFKPLTTTEKVWSCCKWIRRAGWTLPCARSSRRFSIHRFPSRLTSRLRGRARPLPEHSLRWRLMWRQWPPAPASARRIR